MDSRTFSNLGIIELMQLLQELHKLGYQKLRWFSYVSPNGCALRCHITTQDNIFANREIVNFSDSYVWAFSTGQVSSGNDIKPLVRSFIEEISPSLLEKGNGRDEEYVNWFNRIVKRAVNYNEFPLFNGEYFSAPLGHIVIGKNICRTPPMRLRLISWNIDGLKARFDTLKRICLEYDPDIICLQKVKDSKHSKECDLEGYNRVQSSAPYAGVATYIKRYLGGETDLEYDETGLKGHVLRTQFRYPKFTLYNTYVPYSNPQVSGAVEQRRFFDSFITKSVSLQTDRVVMCGDMNIVHTAQDCWDGKFERNQANFNEWERKDFDMLLQCGGLIDTFREFHPHANEYTYFFRNDPKVREKGQGHRIDYFLASESLLPEITRAEIIDDITASTNNPIILEFSY